MGYYNDNFLNFLNSVNNNLTNSLIKNIENINYMDVDFYDTNQIRYINNKNQVNYLKIGRFFNKIANIDGGRYSDSEIEALSNKYKQFIDNNSEIIVVIGEDIMKYYHEKTYYKSSSGTLNVSCMKFNDRNVFTELYTINDNVKMLIRINKNGNITARALLWEECLDYYDNSKVYKLMDRIYYTYDYEIELFKDWATQNGYLYRRTQASNEEIYFLNKNTPEKEMYFITKLKIGNNLPYHDTFKYYNFKKKFFTNKNVYTSDKYVKINKVDGNYNDIRVIANKSLQIFKSDTNDSSEKKTFKDNISSNNVKQKYYEILKSNIKLNNTIKVNDVMSEPMVNINTSDYVVNDVMSEPMVNINTSDYVVNDIVDDNQENNQEKNKKITNNKSLENEVIDYFIKMKNKR